MATRLVLMSDTHLPTRAKVLPRPLLHAVERADAVVHAGDWVDVATLDLLLGLTPRLIGVAGNNDGPELHTRLGEVVRADLDGVRMAVVHETGAAAGRERRMDGEHPGLDLLVFGHSHIPWDTTTPCGMRLLNPGSPTDRRRQPHRTYLEVVLDAGRIAADLIRLG